LHRMTARELKNRMKLGKTDVGSGKFAATIKCPDAQDQITSALRCLNKHGFKDIRKKCDSKQLNLHDAVK
jgi:hypothetical protein